MNLAQTCVRENPRRQFIKRQPTLPKLGVEMTAEIKKIADSLKTGKTTTPVTVRNLLGWYGAKRRGQHVVAMIEEDLKANGIATFPNFESEWLDEFVTFITNDDLQKMEAPEIEGTSGSGSADVMTLRSLDPEPYDQRDPGHQVSRLQAASNKPVVANPNDLISKAITKMLLHDYSQLPVCSSDRVLDGVITWKSIGRRLALGKNGKTVREFMEPAKEVLWDDSIFHVMELIAKDDFVIVRNIEKEVSGIVTATDISETFQGHAAPFLYLGQIEINLRNFIGNTFTVDELKDIKHPDDPREVRSIADLTLGETIRLIENEERWEKLNLNLDRKEFCKRLIEIKNTRNDVMHFDPDGLDDSDLQQLRETAEALADLLR